MQASSITARTSGAVGPRHCRTAGLLCRAAGAAKNAVDDRRELTSGDHIGANAIEAPAGDRLKVERAPWTIHQRDVEKHGPNRPARNPAHQQHIHRGDDCEETEDFQGGDLDELDD
jgi:hypothetical protein